MPSHNDWMQEAMNMAEEALAAQEVPVGCVFVHNDRIIAKARNRTNQLRNATRHAELEAIDQILSENPEIRDLSEITLYVTVEPCIMCASALRQMGIAHVYYGAANERFALFIECNSVALSRGGSSWQALLALLTERYGLKVFVIDEDKGAVVPWSEPTGDVCWNLLCRY